VLYLWLIILSVGCDISIYNESLLVTDFMNLKIKPARSFKDAYRSMVYVRMFI
jgi:hypothetical protein